MNWIGKATINPLVFYSGKISGYLTWVILILSFPQINVISRISNSYVDFISYFLLLAGLCFIFISMISLGRSTRLGLPSENTVLKTRGLYRFSRNPIYLGFHFLTLSAMLYTLNTWVILAGIYSMMVYHLIILGEEKFLENRFGESYFIYKKKVRRYL